MKTQIVNLGKIQRPKKEFPKNSGVGIFVVYFNVSECIQYHVGGEGLHKKQH